MDLFIFGISNLENIGFSDSDTLMGYNAGWVIIERLLQPGLPGLYSDIPVVILSTRTATKKDETILAKLRAGGADIPYFEKHGITPSGETCGSEFREHILKLTSGCK